MPLTLSWRLTSPTDLLICGSAKLFPRFPGDSQQLQGALGRARWLLSNEAPALFWEAAGYQGDVMRKMYRQVRAVDLWPVGLATRWSDLK